MDELLEVLMFTVSSIVSAFILALVIIVVYITCCGSHHGVSLGDGIPGAFDDLERFQEEEQDALDIMDDQNRQSYLMAKRWIEHNPPNSADTDISLSQYMTIQEKAVAAWEFTFDIRQQPGVFVRNRTEIEFRAREPSVEGDGPTANQTLCVQTNLPLPKQKAVYYWETKIYSLEPGVVCSVGLTTKPYPVFRLPGMHRYSVAYDSTGHKRLNQPFGAIPYGRTWQRGDVIGVGYRTHSGTVFFTHNGKKLDDAVHGMRLNLFLTVGTTGPANLYVNLGQDGFVLIPANVNDWGLAPAQGSLAPPPAYGNQDDSVLLESTRAVAGPSHSPAEAPPYVLRRQSDEAYASIHTPPGSPPLLHTNNSEDPQTVEEVVEESEAQTETTETTEVESDERVQIPESVDADTNTHDSVPTTDSASDR